MQPENPAVTLVMPLLDAHPYISEALASLRFQGDVAFEVIAIDSGSTDGTREALAACPHVRTIDAPGLSQTAAINRGFAEARGELLGWLNGDDVLAPGALPFVVDWFAHNEGADFLYGDSIAINQKGRRYGVRSNVQRGQYEQLLHGDFIVQPSAFWRREVFDQFGPLDESLHFAFDYSFFLEVASKMDLHYEPIVLSFERLHGGQKTSRGGEDRADELRCVMEGHIGRQVPAAFLPEVGAVDALAGLRRLRSGEYVEARELLGRAMNDGRPRHFALAHLIAMVLGGPRGTAEARLLSNWVRSKAARRDPVWPTESSVRSSR